MKISFVKFILFAPFLSTVSCTSLLEREGGSYPYQDSHLTDLNPAPAQLAVPEELGSGSDGVIDPVYLSAKADYHFTLGEAHSLDGRSQRAIDEFKLTLVYQPESASVRIRLAGEYVRIGLLTEALEQSEEAARLDPKSVRARILLGGLYTALKMYDQARAKYQEVMEISPGHSDAGIFYGAILAEQGQFDEAVSHFKSYFKKSKDEDRAKAYFYIARVHMEKKPKSDPKAAEKAFIRSLSFEPENVEAVMSYAGLLMQLKRDDEAQKLLKSFQRRFGPKVSLSKFLSQQYLSAGKYDEALEHLEVVEASDRDNYNVRIQIALILIEQGKLQAAAERLEDILVLAPELDKIRYYLGAVYEQLENWSGSVTQYLSVPSTSGYYAESVVHAAHIEQKRGRLKKALSYMEKGLSQRDDLAQFYPYYASLLEEAKEFRKGIRVLEGARKKFPKNTQILFYLGSLFDRVGQPMDGIEPMRKILEIDPSHAQAMNFVAYTYADANKNLEEAYELATKALAARPKDPYVLDTMGWVYFRKGNTKEAIKYLEAAYEIKSDESIISEHLADAYYQGEMLDRALVFYQKAAEISEGPEIDRIKAKIVSISNQLQSPPSPTGFTGARTPASDPQAN